MFLLVSFSSCWETSTHVSIGANAFQILNNDKPEGADFYFSQSSSLLNVVKKGFIDPDWEEKATGTHYYVWPGECENNGQYFKNAFFAFSRESARTRLENHYREGVNDYCNGNIESAFLHIGRACHYIQDIGCPAHSGGIQYPIFGTNHHKLYENYIDGVNQPKAETAAELYGVMDNGRIGYVLNDLAQTTGRLAPNVKSQDTKKYDETLFTVPLSAQYTAVLLDMFARDASKCKLNMQNQTDTNSQRRRGERVIPCQDSL